MSEKEIFNKSELRKSYNTYHKFYRMKRSPIGKDNWGRFILDKKTIETIQQHGKDIVGNFDFKTYPYNPYLYFVIKWRLMFVRDYFNKKSTRKEIKFWGGILIPIIATFIALLSVIDNKINRKESIEILEKNITKNQELTKAKHKVLEGKIFLLTQKIDSVHLNHLENIRVLEKKIEKKK
jgi:hypothetical protein